MLMGSRLKSRYGLLCNFVIALVLLAGPGASDTVTTGAGGENAISWHPDYAAKQHGVRQNTTLNELPAEARDTLQFNSAAGQVFITVLPDSVSSGSVIEMSNVRVPANSWRTGRAFFWQIGPDNAGVYHIDFLVRTRASIDTLTLAVSVG